MNYRMICYVIALLLYMEAAFMVPAAGISLIHNETMALHGFFSAILILLVTASLFMILSAKRKRGFYAKEGMIVTGLAWIIMSMLGCLPFYISGEIPLYIDALFETVSGFTTTGTSILTDIEVLDRGLLYWRSFTHWVGGMGVLVFLLAVVPLNGKNQGFTLHILRAESPGPSVGKLVPKMKQTALILYLLYVILTVLDVFFLLLGGMPLFDAVTTAFGTAGTGGFAIKNASLAEYSPYIQNVTTVFMLLFGINFSCYFLILMKRFTDVLKDQELHLYLFIVLASTGLIAWNIGPMFPTVREAVHHAAFQVASYISTSGFLTVPTNDWPGFSKAILLFLMISGACAGSTGGGIKVARLMLLFKSLRRNIHQQIRPNLKEFVRVNGERVDERVMTNVNAYLIAYVLFIIISFLLISLDGYSIEANVSAVLTTFNNIGPGFAEMAGDFHTYSVLSKAVLITDMLAGRLEIMPILILFSRETWKKV